MNRIHGEQNHKGFIPNKPRDYSMHLGLQKPRDCMMLNVELETLDHTDPTQPP